MPGVASAPVPTPAWSSHQAENPHQHGHNLFEIGIDRRLTIDQEIRQRPLLVEYTEKPLDCVVPLWPCAEFTPLKGVALCG